VWPTMEQLPRSQSIPATCIDESHVYTNVHAFYASDRVTKQTRSRSDGRLPREAEISPTFTKSRHVRFMTASGTGVRNELRDSEDVLMDRPFVLTPHLTS